MDDSIKALIELGEVDAQISQLRKELEALPAELTVLESRVAAAESAAADSSERKKALRMEADRLNLGLRENEATLEKLRTQLNAAKSNKEYDLIREQMKDVEAKNSDLEEKILTALEDVDSIDATAAGREGEARSAGSELESKRAEIVKKAASVESRIRDLDAQRDGKSSRVHAEDLTRYRRVLSNWGDSAVATVDVDRDGGVCNACSVRLTKQQLNVVMTGRDIVQCQSCRRILYIGEPVR